MDCFKKLILCCCILVLLSGCGRNASAELDWVPTEKPSIESKQNSTGAVYMDEANNSNENQKEYMIPNKCLVIGNSITLGFGTHGMASTDENTDYYYYVKNYLTGLNPYFQIERVDGRIWEGSTTTEDRKAQLQVLLSEGIEDTDLVIIQLGDNVNTAEKQQTFSTDCNVFLETILEKNSNARILWVFGRYNLGNANAIKLACDKYGAEYVDISIISTDVKYMSYIGAPYIWEDGKTRYIENAGVASHPGDEGMRVIADLIIQQLNLESEG